MLLLLLFCNMRIIICKKTRICSVLHGLHVLFVNESFNFGVGIENVLNAEFLFSYYQNFFVISYSKSRFKAL